MTRILGLWRLLIVPEQCLSIHMLPSNLFPARGRRDSEHDMCLSV